MQKKLSMQFLVYLIVYPLLWLISKLPFRLLYILSDFCYILVYYVIRYRRKTVRENLQMVFPTRPLNEIIAIEKKSYQHMCDMFLEMIKTLSISEKEIKKRFTYSNLDTYLNLEKKGKSIALMCAHYASYEWVISMNYHITFKGYAIYKRIRNEYFDDLVKRIRSKFNAYLITTKETSKVIEENNINGVLGVYGFASDQTPRRSPNMHWMNFLGIESAIHFGAEMLSKRFDMNVIYLKVKKIKRGYYEASFEILTENVRELPKYEVSERFMKEVEKQIYEQPEFYLWTHKRWKHKRID